jgi:hypothetical protein
MNSLVIALHGGVVALADKVPSDNDVKAGWGALFLFLGLAAAVAFLCWSLVKQLKKAQSAQDSGVYGTDEAEQSSPKDA